MATFTFETKYNIGDKLYKMYQNKVCEYTIRNITFNYKDGEVRTTYYIWRDGSLASSYNEEQIDETFFTSKAKLIASLIED